jgi:hypothetical protein
VLPETADDLMGLIMCHTAAGPPARFAAAQLLMIAAKCMVSRQTRLTQQQQYCSHSSFALGGGFGRRPCRLASDRQSHSLHAAHTGCHNGSGRVSQHVNLTRTRIGCLRVCVVCDTMTGALCRSGQTSPAGTAQHPSCSSSWRWTRPGRQQTQPTGWEEAWRTRTAQQQARRRRMNLRGCSWQATEGTGCLRPRWCSWWRRCRWVGVGCDRHWDRPKKRPLSSLQGKACMRKSRP